MEKQVALLQSLQDAYAAQIGLGLVLTNAKGDFLTRPSGSRDWIRWIQDGEQNRLSEESAKWIGLFEPVSKLADYEFKPGIKLMVTPVKADKLSTFYLWAVFFMETRARRTLHEYYGSEENKDLPWKSLRDSIQEWNGEQKRLAAEKLMAAADIASGIITGSIDHAWTRQQLGVLRELTGAVDRTGVGVRDFLAALSQAQRGLDFVGYAARMDETRFQVSEVLGEAGMGLTGSTFSLGEGYLGQVATTRQAGYWPNISRDPRSLFFSLNNVRPQALFCIPIMKNFKVAGLLFGGSRTAAYIPDEVIDLAHAVTALLEANLSIEALREDRNMIHLRLSMLMEIGKTLTVIDDIKRVLFILIDMSLNLVQGSFASVMLSLPSDKVQMVSRGLQQSKVEKYIQTLSRRYTGAHPGDPLSSSPSLSVVDGVPVMECPLYYKNQFLGILSVGLKNEEDFAESKDFMASLCIVGSAAIYRLKENQLSTAPDVAGMLHLSIRQWNPEAYETGKEARDIAKDFAQERGLADRLQDIGDACLLAAYRPDVLGELVPDRQELVRIVGELHLLQEGRSGEGVGTPEPRQESAIVYLALERAGGAARNGSSRSSAPISPELRESFAAYMNRREVVDVEISLGESATAREEYRSDPMQAIRELNTLSTREQEVLSLVAVGRSNREIAEKLFISEHTVKNHMTNIFHKIGVTDRSQLIAMVYQMGYIQAPE